MPDGKVRMVYISTFLQSNMANIDTADYLCYTGIILRIREEMAMKKYRFFLSILVFALFVSLAFPKAEAAEIQYSGTCGDNLTWTLDSEGTLTISGTGAMTDYYSSSSVPWYSYCASIKTVVLESGVTSIGDMAFNSCSNLTSITIPEGLSRIGYGAFALCYNLTDVAIPKSVTSIGDSAFSRCLALAGIWVHEDNENYSSDSYGVLFNKNKTTLIAVPGGMSGEYVIPDGVTSIGGSAFYNCNKLISVTIPDGVTSIGDSAFFACVRMVNLVLPGSITSIGYSAFNECSSMEHVLYTGTWAQWTSLFRYLPDKMLMCTIHEDATGGEVCWTENCQKSGYYCSVCKSYLTEGPASADAHSYENGSCTLCGAEDPDAPKILYSGTCGDNLTWTLDIEGTFIISGTGDMTNYTSSSSVPWYSHRASIKTVMITSGVTSIGKYAFSDCSSLTAITIPDSVTSIGHSALWSCSSLKAITIPDSVTSIGDYAFRLCNNLVSISLGNGVTSIGYCAFGSCSSLTTIVLPPSLTSIDFYAFEGCSSLTAVAIPSGVTSIWAHAFQNCSSLTGIWVDAENPNYSSDSYGVLFNKDKSTLVTAPGAISGSYTIPSSVTGIGNNAFRSCSSLTAVTIPSSVISIGDDAFRSCSSLKHVLYTGTEDQWGDIAIGSPNTELTNATRHYEASGDEVSWTENCQKSGYYCSICKSYLTEGPAVADAHSYENGTCTFCGAADPDFVEPVEQFELSGANVVLGNDLTMNFALLASNLSGTDYYAEIVKHNPDGTTVTTTYPFSSWTAYGPMYLITLDGLVAKQMSDKVEVTIYTTDGTQASYTWVDSIRDYSIRQLNADSNSAKVKTCVADMLNYGAAAQVQFNYNTSDLANATMTDTHKSYATAALDFSQYTNNQVVGDNFFGTILALETNIKMGVFFKGTGYEGYTAKVSYRDHNGNAVSYEVAGADFDATYAAGGMYGIMVDTLVAGDVYQVVTVEVYNGSTLVASVSESMESYVVRQSASLLPIYDALMKFMVSSYNYSH